MTLKHVERGHFQAAVNRKALVSGTCVLTFTYGLALAASLLEILRSTEETLVRAGL